MGVAVCCVVGEALLFSWKCYNCEKGIVIEQVRACGVEADTRMFVSLGSGITGPYFHLADVFQVPTSCQVLL